jgi:hypothetical protein
MEMTDKTIYLDMDGVIVDWMGGVCKTMGVDINDPTFRNRIKNGETCDDVLGAAAIREACDPLGPEWWMNLKLLPWAHRLVETAKKHGSVVFLSSPGNIHHWTTTARVAAFGKIQFIHDNFPEHQLILANEKFHCAGPRKFLVDDMYKHVPPFEKRKGRVFLWPCQFDFEDGEWSIERVLGDLDYFLEKPHMSFPHTLADKGPDMALTSRMP